QVDRWRQERRGGDRKVPDFLWREASRLAMAHGIGTVARAAGLNHGRIRARMRSKSTSRDRRATPEKRIASTRSSGLAKSPFVEVPLSFARTESSMVVEVRSGRGDSIRIENGNTVDMAALVCAFLERRECSR
ncbi:MAG: hypothetical protein SFV15_05370, partial [Polyangiaceae bacterium]|nr:hypothetical protein [Polyangiaceae bacterium]